MYRVVAVNVSIVCAAACAHAPGDGGPTTFAQSLVQDVAASHPDVKGVELAMLQGDGCVTVAATDRGDVGDRCDNREKGALRAGEPHVEIPTRSDPAYVITQALRDRTGVLIGALIMDIVPRPGESRASVVARAQTIRAELEPRITSAEQLAGGTPAASPVAPRDTSYNPQLDPAQFGVAENAWFPLVPGTTWQYRGTGENAAEVNVVTVTSDTRMILGIRATVVRDQVFENGELTEDTWDWFATDREGNVWYLGEDTKEYRNGQVVSTAGSWEAGVDGAKAGIIMWADPAAHFGETYRQEYSYGVAEDMGRIVGLNVSVTVPHGTFSGCIRTEDTTPLEPNVREYKFYCRGVGVVREMDSETAGMELVAIEKR